jgi:hypothetical protein
MRANEITILLEVLNLLAVLGVNPILLPLYALVIFLVWKAST